LAQQFDVSLKLLFQRSRGLVARELFGGPVETWLNVELPTIQNPRVDMLARAADGCLRHVELESHNSAELPRRVAEYYLGFHRHLKAHVDMVVLYVGREPLRMTSRFQTPSMLFEYRLLDIREFDGEPLVESEDLGDNMLALLTDFDPERVLQRVEARLRDLEAGEKSDAARLFVVLSGLRGLAKAVGGRIGMINIMENEVLGPAILKGECNILSAMLEEKFGPLPEWVMEKLQSAKGNQLIDWGKRAMRANDLESVFQ